MSILKEVNPNKSNPIIGIITQNTPIEPKRPVPFDPKKLMEAESIRTTIVVKQDPTGERFQPNT